MKKFNEEERTRLEKSKYVKKVNETQVEFTDEFKEIALREWANGLSPQSIFDKYEIGFSTLGTNRVHNNLQRWKAQSKRPAGFQRIKGSGRPKKLSFNSLEEENKYLRDQLEYQRQENEFLKKLKALEEKYQRKKNIK